MGKTDRVSECVAAALLKAETAFICDPERRPVIHFHNAHVAHLGRTEEQTKEYARRHRWTARRQSFWQGVQAAWLRGRQAALLRSRDAELLEAQELRAQIYRMIKPRLINGVIQFPIEPKSLEGMIRAFLQLDAMIDGKRDSLLSAVEPKLSEIQAQQAEDGPATSLPFTASELRAMAHQILEARRLQRQKQKEHHASEDPEPGSELDRDRVEGKGGTG